MGLWPVEYANVILNQCQFIWEAASVLHLVCSHDRIVGGIVELSVGLA